MCRVAVCVLLASSCVSGDTWVGVQWCEAGQGALEVLVLTHVLCGCVSECVCLSMCACVCCCCAGLQDIAIVPFLVLLPLIENNGGMEGASADTLLQVSHEPVCHQPAAGDVG